MEIIKAVEMGRETGFYCSITLAELRSVGFAVALMHDAIHGDHFKKPEDKEACQAAMSQIIQLAVTLATFIQHSRPGCPGQEKETEQELKEALAWFQEKAKQNGLGWEEKKRHMEKPFQDN